MKILAAKKIVVLEPTTLDEVSMKSSIYVAEAKAPEVGKVIAVGGGKPPIPMKVGDIIFYRKYGESSFFVGAKQRLFVSFDDVLGVIEK